VNERAFRGRVRHIPDFASGAERVTYSISPPPLLNRLLAHYGFVFLNRNGARRLLILAERDPYDATPQTFSPFK